MERKKILKKKLTFHVPSEEQKLAWDFLNKNFRDKQGNPKYFDYLSVEEGSGYITITIYKKEPVIYKLLTLKKDWYKYPNSLKGAIFREWRRLRREKGFYGYP